MPDLPVWTPEIDWANPPKNPPAEGTIVSSVEEARRHLAFWPREPKGLGKPDFIWVSTGSGELWYRHISFKYESAALGIIRVEMWMDPVSMPERVQSWREQVARNGDPCIRGRSEMVSLKKETEALIGFPPEQSYVNINWREDVVMIQVAGPTLQRDDAIAVAKKL
jgi:hypothetical protein